MDSESRRSEPDESQLSALPPSDSDSSSDSDNEQQRIEWLATSRSRRSTAGNRMKSMLANEEPDSDLELLFAEDEDDQGFSDVAEDASDVQMDSSSDDEDEHNAADDMEGEKELERQAMERRAAQRKRKAQEAIPAKFRKKVRINPAASDTSTPAPTPAPAPAPRLKKKSERASWLPSPADLPTRASSRKTTRMSKEQLHQQMIEREERRLKQLERMQKKAAKMEALKKPPMTQEDRLREAATVEKRNSKSLNRWEVAEKQREEERRAKLAALNQRTLKGPVITFWTGIGEARRVVIEEEKPKKKRERVDKGAKANDKTNLKANEAGNDGSANPSSNQPTVSHIFAPKEASPVGVDDTPQPPQPIPPTTQSQSSEGQPSLLSDDSKDKGPPLMPTNEESKGQEIKDQEVKGQESMPVEAAGPRPPTIVPSDSLPPTDGTPSTVLSSVPTAKRDEDNQPRQPLMAMPSAPPPPSGLAAPAAHPSAPPRQRSPLATPAGMVNARAPENKPSGVLAAPILAPPPSMNGDYRPSPGPKSNILAPPNTSHPGPTLPVPVVHVPATNPTTDIATLPTGPFIYNAILEPIKTESVSMSKSASPSLSEPPPQSATAASAPETTTRNAIIFQNFDENAIKDKSIQTQILFGRKMSRLAKPAPNPICVITNLPARYRDPKTGLPYYNAFAYGEIQRLSRGEHRWSTIINAWVGSGKLASRGVPERFLNPNAPTKTPEEREKERLAQVKASHPPHQPQTLSSPSIAKGQGAQPQPQPQPQPQFQRPQTQLQHPNQGQGQQIPQKQYPPKPHPPLSQQSQQLQASWRQTPNPIPISKQQTPSPLAPPSTIPQKQQQQQQVLQNQASVRTPTTRVLPTSSTLTSLPQPQHQHQHQPTTPQNTSKTPSIPATAPTSTQ